MSPKRGEIWLVNFNPKTGAEMGSSHPAVVVSRDDVGKLPLRVVVPVTTSQPALASLPWMVALTPNNSNGLRHPSLADCFQPRSFDIGRFVQLWGTLDNATVEDIAQTVARVLGVGV